ncbi:hypothetical protein JTE90_004257 [Oedothorax gibbosus]|uniref:Regulatory protein zeste n=1 Tax=Oedothorax gibbosus TaxID=931172 RepID=A0AAV6UEI3_9ARAC|nr:hypothetical protein JTE90_004257 [Oedothorax gibbosus]
MDKQRSKNFTPLEEEILLNCVSEYTKVIDCKETNALKADAKVKAWLSVTELYNSQSSVTKRSLNQLKSKYKNLKAASRKRLADEKLEIFLTGGGSKKISATEADALLVANGAVVRPLLNSWDSDAPYEAVTSGEEIFTLFLTCK